SLLDLVVNATNRLAVFPQNDQLVRQLGSGEEVAGVRILCDQAQRFLLAHAPDQDARAGPAHGLRGIERSLQLVVLAVEGFLAASLTVPHLQADLQRLFQSLEAFGDGRERNTKAATFGL